ncbi:MAG: SMC-Scp complex subunit ScpB [Chloroflexi bacterium]|nr:SMC-Scp complex subunit ScpB [Chloroflexota bacterium]
MTTEPTDAAAGAEALAAAVATPVGVRELEALLFVAERPLSRRALGQLCGIERERVDTLLGDLEVALQGRGIRLTSVGEHVQLTTAPEAGPLIGRYVGADGARVSAAAMEALAIVAYRQPVTRGGVERIRGVDSDYVIRSLMQRRLIVEQGRADTPGRPILYATSFEFMERFGLTSLEELPPLDPEVAARLALNIEEPRGSEGTHTDHEAADDDATDGALA